MVVATTGFFDGVHRGHRKVIDTLCRRAGELGAESAVVTFWPHPRNVLRQDARDLRLLTSLEEKKELLKACGVDQIHVINFTRQFSMLSCEEFIKDYIIGKLGATEMIVGYDHHLGNPAFSTDIASVASGLGLKTIKEESVSDQYNTISSTYIRNLIATGGVVVSAVTLTSSDILYPTIQYILDPLARRGISSLSLFGIFSLIM